MKRTTRKPPIPHPLALALLGAGLAAHAAVQVCWTVETSRVQPSVFDAVAGTTSGLDGGFLPYVTLLG